MFCFYLFFKITNRLNISKKYLPLILNNSSCALFMVEILVKMCFCCVLTNKNVQNHKVNLNVKYVRSHPVKV